VAPSETLVSLDASPFAGAGQYYDRFRPPYARAAIGFIVEAYDFSDGVLALGLRCGLGSIAIPLWYTAAEVVAVAADGDMIAEGRLRWVIPRLGPCRNRSTLNVTGCLTGMATHGAL
jgi:hypothetical protein